MQFATSSVFLAHMIESGTSQAAHVAPVDASILRVAITPEWLAENAAKQVAYERRRAAYLKDIGVITT
jgi:hypothetical protein